MTIVTRHILLVEDNPVDARLILGLLRKAKLQAFDIECVGDLADAIQRLVARKFDAVLLDLSLPDSEGMETFSRVQAEAPDVPVVILTGLDDEDTAVRAVGAGAQDYLMKGQVQGPLLVRALQYAIERKRAEEALRKSEDATRTLNAELEQRVRERTAQLEAVNKELEAFSYSVSHDLRAPLRVIDGFSKILLDRYAERLEAQGQHYLQRVREGAQRMDELIHDLLMLSRISRAEIHWESVDLTALTRAIVAQLQAAQPERRVECVITDGVVAQGDPGLLRVALENLLGNSWKYTNKHATARIEFGITQEDGQRIYFVRDDGAGFDMAYADKLFDAFQRLHGAADFEGTGIGLATVQRIIRRHGGRVWAEGAMERGATFYFTLPANAPVQPASSEPT